MAAPLQTVIQYHQAQMNREVHTVFTQNIGQAPSIIPLADKEAMLQELIIQSLDQVIINDIDFDYNAVNTHFNEITDPADQLYANSVLNRLLQNPNRTNVTVAQLYNEILTNVYFSSFHCHFSPSSKGSRFKITLLHVVSNISQM
jgi:hypothetical protein